MLNSNSARYDSVPTYYAIISSSPLEMIASEEVLLQSRMSLEGLVEQLRQDGSDAAFDPEFVRLMRQSGHFQELERGVVLLSPTTFSARIPIESDAANGPYLARALILSEGELVGEATTRFTVRTQGFERYVAEAARSDSVLYGLASILLALATGWLGGVLFQR